MTLADHAEAWWGEQGYTAPLRNTSQWQAMYAAWIEFAFGPIVESHRNTLGFHRENL